MIWTQKDFITLKDVGIAYRKAKADLFLRPLPRTTHSLFVSNTYKGTFSGIPKL